MQAPQRFGALDNIDWEWVAKKVNRAFSDCRNKW
jgi:hypothetical protein